MIGIRIITLIVLVQYGFLPRAEAMEGSRKRSADSEWEKSRPTKQGRVKKETNTAGELINALTKALEGRNVKEFDRIVRFCDIGEISVQEYQHLLSLARLSDQPKIEKRIALELKNLDQAHLLNVLREALQSGNWNIVKEMVNIKGINYNFAYSFNRDGTQDEIVTVLSVALEDGKTELYRIQSLVECGATLNSEVMGQGLQNALKQRNYRLARYLLDHGANVYQGSYSYSLDELKLLIDYGWFDPSAALIKWISELSTTPQLFDCICYILLHGFYQPDVFSRVFVQGAKLSSEEILVNKLLDTSLQSGKSQELAETQEQQSCTSWREGKVCSLFSRVERIVKFLFSDLPISSAVILCRDEKRISAIKDLLEKALARSFPESTKDLNQATIIAAGRGDTLLLTTILQRTDILTLETIVKALYAAGIACRLGSFQALIGSIKVPGEELQRVLQNLLRPLIMRGDEEFIKLILYTARNAAIILDTVPFETGLDTLLASDSCTEKHARFEAIKRLLEEYRSTMNGINPLVETDPMDFLSLEVDMLPAQDFPFTHK